LFVPETMTLMKLLEQFMPTHLPVALLVDEFDGVDGLVSRADVARLSASLPQTRARQHRAGFRFDSQV
jgi:hypothetical protein